MTCLSVAQSEKKDCRPFANVKFDSFAINSLLDTGSEVTILDFKSFCKLNTRPRLSPAPYALRSATGDPIPVRGMAKLEIEIANKRMVRNVCIIESRSQKCIIGADTLLEEKLNLEMGSKAIFSSTVPVVNLESVSIEPHSEKVIRAKVSTMNGVGIVTSENAYMVDELVRVDEGRSMVLVQNPSDHLLTIEKNDPLRNYERANPNAIKADILPPNNQTNRVRNNNIFKDLDLRSIPIEYHATYRDLISSHSDVFSLDPNDIGRCRAITQKIELIDPKKVSCIPPYRTPHHLQPIVNDYVNKLVNSGVIRKSNSPFSSPLMLVRKATAQPSQPLVEQYRVVHDYRHLNSNTVKDSYPMHNLYDLIDRVSQAKIWSVIDLSSGFWNQLLDEDSRKYTSFGVPGVGHYEYTRSAQGLCNSPPAFQRLLDFITKGLPNVYVYVDDVVICSDTHREHQETLGLLLKRFRKYQLKCRLKKVQLGATEINYLGYNLSHSKGIRAGEQKIDAVSKWKPPSTVKEIKQFLGLCSFFRRTIKGFASIVSPLTKLTRKQANWIDGRLPQEALQAFNTLKEKLCSRPCLTPVDFKKEFILTVDASGTGLGAVLSQLGNDGTERPCAYASRSLSDVERKRAPFHLEYMAMTWACKHFKPYLAGRHFTIRTDHKPLLSLNKTKGTTIERLQMELDQFQPYTIEYMKGEKIPADGLSRLYENKTEEIEMSLNVNWDQIYDLQRQDLQAKALCCKLKYDSLPSNRELRNFVLENVRSLSQKKGVLGKLEKDVFKPYAPRALRETILRLSHDDFLAGHYSTEKTKEKIQSSWYWPQMNTDIEIYCKSCHICHSNNNPAHKRPVPLESLKTVSYFNERVHIDLLGPLPNDRGCRYLMVMIDAYSKLVELAPLPNKEMGTVSEAFLNNWISRHGICHQLNSDLGLEFKNEMFKILSNRLGISQVFSSVSHPQSNGLAERQVRTIIEYFRKTLNDTNEWVQLLPSLMFASNTTSHASTKYTPFMAAYTRLPQLPLSLGPERTYNESPIAQQLSLMARIRQNTMKNQATAFEQQKLQFDKRSRKKEVQIGDVVYLIRGHRGRQFQKFQPNYDGPFRVIKKGQNNNILLEPFGKNVSRKKSVWVHINLVKLAPFVRQLVDYEGEDITQAEPPPLPPLSETVSGADDGNYELHTPTLNDSTTVPTSPTTETQLPVPLVETRPPVQQNIPAAARQENISLPLPADSIPSDNESTTAVSPSTPQDPLAGPADAAAAATGLPRDTGTRPRTSAQKRTRHESEGDDQTGKRNMPAETPAGARHLTRSAGVQLPADVLSTYPEERRKSKKEGREKEKKVLGSLKVF